MHFSVIARFFKKHAVFFLHIVITLLLSIGLTLLFKKFPEYKWLANLGVGIYFVYNIYRMVFKKTYVYPFLKIICILVLWTIVNEFYSYPKLIEVLHLPETLESNAMIGMVVGVLLILCVIMKLLSFKEMEEFDRSKNNEAIRDSIHPAKADNPAFSISSADRNENDKHNSSQADLKATMPSSAPIKNGSKEEFYSFLRFLIVLAICGIFIVIPMVWLYHFNTSNPPDSILDFDQIFSFLLCNGVAFLLILSALLAVVYILIAVGKCIVIQIRSIKQISDREIKSLNSVPPYSLSIIIVVVLMFLGWRLTDFSLDNLTEILVLGDYLAFPVAVIVLLVLFYILVQLVHAIILMLSRINSQNIVRFISDSDNELEFTKRAIMILKNIVDIILDTILTTLAFVKFVPNFFAAMQKMVLEDDDSESEIGEHKNKQPKGVEGDTGEENT